MSDHRIRNVEPSALSMGGIVVNVPPGWETRIRKAAPTDPGGTFLPVLHAATVPLPGRRADYGDGVVETLGTTDLFVALIEYGEEAVGSNLYPRIDDIPFITPGSFHPHQLHHRYPGQAGVQVFFTHKERAFCLYVVIGSYSRRIELARKANELIAQLAIIPNP